MLKSDLRQLIPSIFSKNVFPWYFVMKFKKKTKCFSLSFVFQNRFQATLYDIWVTADPSVVLNLSNQNSAHLYQKSSSGQKKSADENHRTQTTREVCRGTWRALTPSKYLRRTKNFRNKTSSRYWRIQYLQKAIKKLKASIFLAIYNNFKVTI